MGTTFANGIWSPARSEPIELHVLAGVLSSAASNAIAGRGEGRRQPREFTAANQTEKALIEGLFTGGLIEGDRVYVADTQWWETYTSGLKWKLTETTVWIPYVPTPSYAFNVTLGNGTTNCVYWVKDGRVTISGSVDLGTTGYLGVSTYCYFPLPTGLTGLAKEVGGIGTCIASGPNGEKFYGEMVSRISTFERVALTFKTSPTNGGLRTPMQSGVPRDWGTATANRQFAVLFTYTAA